MTNPTRQEIIDAHEALSDLTYLADKYITSTLGGLDETRKLRQSILAALPPKPQPTMAEVEWDDEKHYLAEAEQCKYGKVIMLGLDETGFIEFFIPRLSENRYGRVHPDTLTPTGKRYTLTEVQDD